MGKISLGRMIDALENPIIDKKTGCFTRKLKECLVGATGTKHKKRDSYMSRWSINFFKGPPPAGKNHVCHKCDNSKCFNPSHLFWGSNDDNHNDKTRKGRQPYGPNNLEPSKNNRITIDDVYEIRRLYSNNVSQVEIARQFKVGSSTIYRIVRGIRWRHLNLPDLYPNETAFGTSRKEFDRIKRENGTIKIKTIDV